MGRAEDVRSRSRRPSPRRPSRETVATSKVLPKFLAALAHHDRRSCSISVRSSEPTSRSSATGWPAGFSVEDLYVDIEAQARRGRDGRASGRPFQRVSLADSRVVRRHPVLGPVRLSRPATGQAWPLDWPSLLRPGGVLYGFFGTTAVDLHALHALRRRGSGHVPPAGLPGHARQRNVLVTRDINRMFDGLAVTESVLLKTAPARRCSENLAG